MTMFEEEGMDELLDQIEKLGDMAKDIEKKALKAGGDTLQEEYKSNIYKRIDRDTGTARRSITVSNVSNSKIHVGPTKDAFYLNFLENGFYNVRARKFISATPIFGPLFLQSRTKVLNAMIEAARKELNEL